MLTLKQVISTVIVSLIEETPPEEGDSSDATANKTAQVGVSQEVIDALDPESIWQVALDCYTQTVVSHPQVLHPNDYRYLSFSQFQTLNILILSILEGCESTVFLFRLQHIYSVYTLSKIILFCYQVHDKHIIFMTEILAQASAALFAIQD